MAETTSEAPTPAKSLSSTTDSQNEPQGTLFVETGCIRMDLKDGLVVASKIDDKCDCSLDLTEGVSPKDAKKLSSMLYSIALAAD